MRYIMGMDVGGTKTQCIICDQNRNICGYGKSGGANYQITGKEKARKEIEKAYKEALDMASLSPNDIDAACLGIAGADMESDFIIIREIINSIKELSANNKIVNDMDIILKLGTIDGEGIAVGFGTGQNTVGINKEGVRKSIGSWGYRLGDNAGAVSLGVMGMRAAVRGYDGRGKKTMLTDIIVQEYNFSNMDSVIERFMVQDSEQKINFSDISPLVVKAAKMGDEEAQRIVEKSIDEIVTCVKVLKQQLFPDNDEMKVVVSGGVVKAEKEIFIDGIETKIKRLFPDISVLIPKLNPVFGALLYAYEMIGIHLDERIINELEKSYKQYM